MGFLLREAFAYASGLYHNIADGYERLGFLVFRAMSDSSFLSAQPAQFHSATWRQGAEFYDLAKDKARRSIMDDMEETTIQCDFSPKPSVSDICGKALESTAQIIPKMNPALLMAFAATGICACAYFLSHGGTHMISEALSTWLGSGPNGASRLEPRP